MLWANTSQEESNLMNLAVVFSLREGHSQHPKGKGNFVWNSHPGTSGLLYWKWLYFIVRGKRTFWGKYTRGPWSQTHPWWCRYYIWSYSLERNSEVKTVTFLLRVWINTSVLEPISSSLPKIHVPTFDRFESWKILSNDTCRVDSQPIFCTCSKFSQHTKTHDFLPFSGTHPPCVWTAFELNTPFWSARSGRIVAIEALESQVSLLRFSLTFQMQSLLLRIF